MAVALLIWMGVGETRSGTQLPVTTPGAPGAGGAGPKTLSATITPGEWRYETTIRLGNGGGETVLTQPFTVSAN